MPRRCIEKIATIDVSISISISISSINLAYVIHFDRGLWETVDSGLPWSQDMR